MVVVVGTNMSQLQKVSEYIDGWEKVTDYVDNGIWRWKRQSTKRTMISRDIVEIIIATEEEMRY
jgi:hypothetical protein